MRKLIAIPFLTLLACQTGGTEDTVTQQQQPQALVCSDGDVPIYSNTFVPQVGASGVATAPEAAAGIISSDATGTGSTVGGTASLGPAVGATGTPTTTAPPPSTPPLAASDGGSATGPITAMVATCGTAPCAPDQVAVDIPPAPNPTTGVTGTAGPTAAGAPIATSTAVSDTTAARPATAGAAAPTAGAAAPAAASSPPANNLVCTSPPPPCPEGQSPQFTMKHTWVCTDCALVVTYGYIYGNYRRCVDEPHLECPQGQVPTWVVEDEQWECKSTCNNGTYDQHAIQGQTVCVPC
jgi:hypothetical protein